MITQEISDEGRLALTQWAIQIAKESDDPRATAAVEVYEQQAEEIKARIAASSPLDQVILLKPMMAKAERK